MHKPLEDTDAGIPVGELALSDYGTMPLLPG